MTLEQIAKIKAANFDNMLKDFEAYIAPVAINHGWYTHYNKNNWVPPNSKDPDNDGHNPIQVLFCLAMQCGNWNEVCQKTGSICVSIMGVKTNL